MKTAPVGNFLQKNVDLIPYPLSKKDMEIIISIVCKDRSVTIGAPSSPIITKETLSRLQAEIDGNVTVSKVNVGLRKIGLNKKYRRHRYAITRMLGGEALYKWDPVSVKAMLVKFRRIEYYWKHFRKKLFKHRCTFFSYPTMIYYFLEELGETPCESLLLKSVTLRGLQYSMYKQLLLLIHDSEAYKRK